MMGQYLKTLGLIFSLAATYWLSARLGLALTAPPVFATAVWPPAGVALGATLIWGKRALPGIWLGAVFANARFSWLEPIPTEGFLLAAGIAIGASLQAGLVAQWIRSGKGYAEAFKNDRSIVRLLILAGPVGCFINATFGNGLLLWLGMANLSDVPINWATWWAGDTIGALIFTPLMLIVLAHPHSFWRPMWRTVAMPLTLSFMLVMGLFAYASSVEKQRRQNEFLHLADVATASLNASLRDYGATLAALKGLFDASEQVSCAEFQSFAQTLLTGKHVLQALEWAQSVSLDERKVFEQGQRLCGKQGAVITEMGSQGKLVAAEVRPAYLPVVYIEPLQPNQQALGFNLISESARREAIEAARDQNRQTASRMIRLVQAPQARSSLLLVAPIYRKQADLGTLEGRRANFKGVVLGVLRIEDVLGEALKSLGSQRALLHVQIEDGSAAPEDRFIYADKGFNAASPLIGVLDFRLADRQWRVTMSGNEGDFGEAWSTWFVLAGGMCLSGLLGGFLLLLAGRTANIERLIVQRTSDLADSNLRLREEITERAKSEASARASEIRFRMLANGAPVLIWLSDIGKRCYWFNQVWLDFTGRKLEQEIDNGWVEGVHPDDVEACMDCFVSHFDRHEPFRMEYRLRRHDGEYRWLLDSGVPLVDDGGKFTGYIGSCIDVTERKQMESETKRLALVAEKSTSGIIITNAAGVIEWVNPAFSMMTGYSFEEAVGQIPGALLQGPDTDSAVIEHMGECLAQQISFDVEILNYRKNSEPVWLHLKVDPVFDAQGRLTQFIGVETDIGERKANEKAIHRLNRSYQDLLAAASEVSIIATDPKGQITLFNRGAEQMLGYSAKEVLGKTPLLFHIPDEILARERLLSQQFGCPVSGFQVFTMKPDVQGQESTEWTYVCKDGLFIWVSLAVTQIKSEEGETTGYLGIAQNITERKAAQEALYRAKLAADKANQAKSEFLANMSHEIRTPMNGILGMLELLRGTPLSAEQQELADIAGQSAGSLMEIINDILDFSKIEAGKLTIERFEFDLRELCETACLLMAMPAHGKGLEFNCFVHPDLNFNVWGDPTRLRQILVNLLGNAVKFTSQGEVSVDVRCLKQSPTSCQVRFQVKDTGIGIRSAELERLFKPFEQAEQSASRRFGGTGLGLSISKSLVKLMGGEIGVDSALDVGSTFWFTVSLERATLQDIPRPSLRLAGLKMLVADDSATNRQILETFLTGWGAVVETCENGKQALDKVIAAHENHAPFDGLVLDQVMPVLGGVEVSRALMEYPGLKSLPRILLASAGPLLEAESQAAGLSVSLSKPVRQSQLFDAVMDAINHVHHQKRIPDRMPDRVLSQYAGQKILLVEDNPVNQRVALKMLERFGITPSLASTGSEALMALEANRYDLVFMDCQIPEFDGFSVTKALRERERIKGLSRTPVLALTANAITGDREKSLAAGMDDHLTKPLALQDLAKAFETWLRIPASGPAEANVQADADASQPSDLAWDYQASLNRLAGDVELLKEVKSLFLIQAPKQMAAMAEANASHVIASAAHNLRGMAGHFLARRVVDLCLEIEDKARQVNMAPTDPLIQRLQIEMKQLILALQE